jgi:hypothetical protein
VRSIVVGASSGVATLALAWVALRFQRVASHDSASAAAAGEALDVLAFGLAALLASRRAFAARRALALVGAPLALVVAAVGIAALRDTPVRNAVGARAPAFAPAARLIAGQ